MTATWVELAQSLVGGLVFVLGAFGLGRWYERRESREQLEAYRAATQRWRQQYEDRCAVDELIEAIQEGPCES